MAPQFLAKAIATRRTATVTSRFSSATEAAPGFEILYLAENQLVAMYEAGVLFGSAASPGAIVPNPNLAITVLPISINLTGIADLTDPVEASRIGTSAQDLTGDWRSYSQRPALASSRTRHSGKAPTQQLGEELFRLGSYHGFISFSAKLPDYKILGVFVERLKKPGESVSYSYTDDHGRLQTIRIP